MNTQLIKLENVSKSFVNPDGKDLQVLQNVNFSIDYGDIVAFVGQSGSGKSTLLRIISGLEQPTKGSVHYKDKLVHEYDSFDGVGFVFQNFALMPWLTVLENVELGLESQGVDKKIRRQRSLKIIDTVGLDGFESAYPKELSGGMKQRVGIARALAIEPELLIMDEPFSSLDVLTSENLRNDLIDLWLANQAKTKAILFVTHEIEEALLMANKIAIFSSNPGRIKTVIPVDLPYPRDSFSEEFSQFIDRIYAELMSSERKRVLRGRVIASLNKEEVSYRLPDVGISELTGLLESIEEQQEKQGEIDLPELAEDLHLDVNGLFPLTEALDMLRFAEISQNEFKLTSVGKEFLDADILTRKKIFAKQLLQHINLAKKIKEVLEESSNNKVGAEVFTTELENFFTEDEAERILKVIIDWGRYAEIFAYDVDSSVFSLENPK